MAIRRHVLCLVIASVLVGCAGRKDVEPAAPSGVAAADEETLALVVAALEKLEQGQAELGLETARQARDRAPGFWMTRVVHGIALSMVGKAQESIEETDRGVTLAPTEPFAWYGRGLAYFNARRGADAVQAFEKSLELGLAPAELAENARVMQRLSVKAQAEVNSLEVFGLIEKGETKAAVDLAERAVAEAPDSYHGHYALAFALITAGRPFDAKGVAQRAMDLGDQAAPAMVALGLAQLSTGDFAKAAAQLDEALGIGLPAPMRDIAVAARDRAKRADSVMGIGDASDAELRERAAAGEVICYAIRTPTPQAQNVWGIRCLSFWPGFSFQEIARIDDGDFYRMQVGVKSHERVIQDDGKRFTDSMTMANGVTSESENVIDFERKCIDTTVKTKLPFGPIESRQKSCFEERSDGAIAMVELDGPLEDPVIFVEGMESFFESYRRWLKENES